MWDSLYDSYVTEYALLSTDSLDMNERRVE